MGFYVINDFDNSIPGLIAGFACATNVKDRLLNEDPSIELEFNKRILIALKEGVTITDIVALNLVQTMVHVLRVSGQEVVELDYAPLESGRGASIYDFTSRQSVVDVLPVTDLRITVKPVAQALGIYSTEHYIKCYLDMMRYLNECSSLSQQ